MANIPVAAFIFFNVAKNIKVGSVTIVTPLNGIYHFEGETPGPKADIKINDWKILNRLFSRGDVGFAEDYIEGNWETSDLPALLTLAALNETALEQFFHGSLKMRIWFMIRNMFRSNTPKGSQRNIRAHYDVGNDFYQLWLDSSMTYSSALFEGDAQKSLEAAQEDKYKRILHHLAGKKVKKTDDNGSILEIGCGWGGFSELAAKSGYRVKGLTLSREQAVFARERLEKAHLNDKTEIALRDYREEKSQFDFVVSIEMFEAVGERYWPVFFEQIKKVLKPGGKAMIQTITIAESLFSDYRKRSDFIQQYTFPGGALPSETRFIEEAEKAGLAVKSVFRFGQDYALTLKKWLDNFEHQITIIRELGYSEAFLRSWRFYLSYCIAGFISERTNVIQAELVHA